MKTRMFLTFAALMAIVLFGGCGGGADSPITPNEPPAQFTPPVHDGYVAAAALNGSQLAQDAPDHFNGKSGVFNFAAVEASAFDSMRPMGNIPYNTTVIRRNNPEWTFDRTNVGWVLGPGEYHLAIQSPNGVIEAELTVEEVTINGLTVARIPFHVGGELDGSPYRPDDGGAYNIPFANEFELRTVWFNGATMVSQPENVDAYGNTVVGSELMRWTNSDRYYGAAGGDVYIVTNGGVNGANEFEMVSSYLPVGVTHIRFTQ